MPGEEADSAGFPSSWQLAIPRDRQTPTFERVKDDKVRHESLQTPASGDTNSRKGWQVAGIREITAAPLDQESPGWPPAAYGSSPGGATFTYYARSKFGKQAGSSSAELTDAGRKRGLRARNAESGEVSYRADGGTPPRCMAGDGIRPGTKVADGGRPHSVPTLIARDACIMVGSSSLPTESSNGPVER
jgi:hypothetical protein